MKKIKAFTLVELIIVITILAILGTITFTSLQGYSKDARDTKRVSDVRSILTKINTENTVGTPLSELIVGEQTTLQILGENNENVYTMGHANFENLNEKRDDFQDPSNGQDYYFAYAAGKTGNGKYNFVQGATISETLNTTKILGNYYTEELNDAPSLFLRGDGDASNPNDYYTEGSEAIYNLDELNNNDNIVCPENPTSWEDFQFEIKLDGDGKKTGTIRGYLGTETDVIIPCKIWEDKVTNIGVGAFMSKGLTSVIIPGSVTNLGDWAFRNNQLTSVIIGNGVMNIEDEVFRNNPLTNIAIPNSVTDIGWRAFYENQLTRVEILNSGINIELEAFNSQLNSTGSGKVYGPENLIDIYYTSTYFDIDKLTDWIPQ